MGNKQSMDQADVERFKKQALFTSNEINLLLHRFIEYGGSLDTSVPSEALLDMPEFKYNPFKYRILRVFSETQTTGTTPPVSPTAAQSTASLLVSSQDISNLYISFTNFLKMLSSFSYRADLAMKTHLAFMIYDFDQDGSISATDIECLLSLALGESKLHPQQIRGIAYEVIDEVDIDGNRSLTELEFGRVLARIQSFSSRLTIDIEGI